MALYAYNCKLPGGKPAEPGLTGPRNDCSWNGLNILCDPFYQPTMDATKVKFGTVQITTGKVSRVAPEGGTLRPINLPGQVASREKLFLLVEALAEIVEQYILIVSMNLISMVSEIFLVL